MNNYTVKYTEFPEPGNIPPGVPNFHSALNFREYVRLYWWHRCENQLDILLPGDFAPPPALSSGDLGQGASL
jgi:hypothetical protein